MREKREKMVRKKTIKHKNLIFRILSFALIVCIGFGVPDAQVVHAGKKSQKTEKSANENGKNDDVDIIGQFGVGPIR